MSHIWILFISEASQFHHYSILWKNNYMFLREKNFVCLSYSLAVWNIRVWDQFGTFYRGIFKNSQPFLRYGLNFDVQRFICKIKKTVREFIDFHYNGTKKIFLRHYFLNFSMPQKLRGGDSTLKVISFPMVIAVLFKYFEENFF